MKILPNPVKEVSNRPKPGLSFKRIGEMLRSEVVEEPDDRPLGYEQEARVRLFGRLEMQIVLLVFEPVELDDGEIALRPISLRQATPGEERAYWERIR